MQKTRFNVESMAVKIKIVLQARQTSSRLPNKVLATVGGLPLVVLAAKRASNLGGDVVVAIPDSAENSELSKVLESAGLAQFRGSESNVLERFVLCTESLDPNDIVIRITSDNTFPDGAFLKKIADYFVASSAGYVGVDYKEGSHPYGLGAEVFRVASLRLALQRAETTYDREHVTPWIIRNSSCQWFALSGLPLDAGKFRATVDTTCDLELIRSTFTKVDNPVSSSCLDLSEALVAAAAEIKMLPGRLVKGRWLANTAVGTVQLGMPYGVANRTGVPTDRDCDQMLDFAMSRGVTLFDTAQVYGESEVRLGRWLRGRSDPPIVCTKLRPDYVSPNGGGSDDGFIASVRDNVAQSVSKLGKQPEFFMLHSWGMRKSFGGRLWEALLNLRDSGHVAALGASVLNVCEFEEALLDPDVEIIQFPFSIVDDRWDGLIEEWQRSGKILVARSVFLQGMLLKSAGEWPEWASESAAVCEALDRLVAQLGRQNRVDLCLAFVRAFKSITCTVFGAESLQQVEESLSWQTQPSLTQAEVQTCRKTLQNVASQRLLDPWRWNEKSKV